MIKTSLTNNLTLKKKNFKRYDLNKIGKLSKNDIISLSTSFASALKLSNKDILKDDYFMNNLINELDVDRNGLISENEFIDGLIKNRLYRDCLAGFI